MFVVSAILATLSVVAIWPVGSTRSEVWGAPKVLALTALVLFNFLLLLPRIRTAVASLVTYRVQILAWLFFFLVVLASGIRSTFAQRAIYGHGAMAMGLNTWALIFLMIVTTYALGRVRPAAIGAQMIGFGLAGVLVACAVIVQAADPTMDFTVTAGQLVFDNNRQLLSSIYLQQMPIGLNLHRGQAGAILFLTMLLALSEVLGVQGRLTYARVTWFWYVVLLATSIALVHVSTRAPWLAAATGVTSLVVLAIRAKVSLMTILRTLSVVAVGVVLSSFLGQELGWNRDARRLPGIDSGFDGLASGRLSLWRLAVEGIQTKPLLGWGSDGYGILVAHLEAQKNSETLRALGDYFAYTVDEEGRQHVRPLATNKAHNIALDILVSYGLLGLLAYGSVVLLTVRQLVRARAFAAVGICIAYGVYLLTWFDAIGHVHLAWWAASAMTMADSSAVGSDALV